MTKQNPLNVSIGDIISVDGKYERVVKIYPHYEYDHIKYGNRFKHGSRLNTCRANNVEKVIIRNNLCPIFPAHVFNEQSIKMRLLDMKLSTYNKHIIVGPLPILANGILAKINYVNAFYGIDECKLYTEWQKAQCPGLIQNPPEQLAFLLRGILVVHRKKFKNWLLRVLPKIIKTKKEWIAEEKAYDEQQQLRYEGV